LNPGGDICVKEGGALEEKEKTDKKKEQIEYVERMPRPVFGACRPVRSLIFALKRGALINQKRLRNIGRGKRWGCYVLRT